ncbi:MAG: BMP family ABC transporter substrate-binding protein [Treponema sp.]|nr:BMP family ABC transporter substrate-binding protein [Treponema sp.]
MKKLLLLTLSLLGIASVVFAGGAKDAGSASADNRPTIRLVTDATGVDDKSFNAAAWRGILSFYGDTWENQKNRGSLYEVIACQTQDMYIPVLKQIADDTPDLIVVTGFTFADALSEVAQLYPDQKFMIVDVDYVTLPNVMNFVFTEDQGSFLVGAAVALQAKEEKIANPKFGFIGGVPGATITKFEVGYIQGLKYILPNADVVDYYANDWGKPDLAKTQAKNWYDSGVYAIFSAAGGTGNGTISQAKEYRMAGKNVWAIGVDSDQYSDGIYEGTKSSVLTSMIKRVESATGYALKAVADGSFKGGVVSLSLKDAGVGYATSNPELKESVVKQLKTIESDIVSGKIKVIPTYKDALAAGKVPAGLSAKDN